MSVISATAATSVLWTMTGPATRGRMCRVMIRRSGSPATLAASMYSSCRAPIVADLTTRATGADSRMPSGMTAGVRLPAKIDSTTTRMTTMGSASRTLTQPLRTRSADFSQKPAATPTLTPRATATTTTSKVARRTGRPPYSSLLRTSLPSSSVPSRWLSDGPFEDGGVLVRLRAVGGGPVRQGACDHHAGEEQERRQPQGFACHPPRDVHHRGAAPVAARPGGAGWAVLDATVIGPSPSG